MSTDQARRADHARKLHRRALHTARYWRGEGDRAEAAWALTDAATHRRTITTQKAKTA